MAPGLAPRAVSTFGNETGRGNCAGMQQGVSEAGRSGEASCRARPTAGRTDRPWPACSSGQGKGGGVGVNETMGRNSARGLQMGHPSRPRAPGLRHACWPPGGSGRWRVGGGGSNWGTKQTLLCRQHLDRGAGREKSACLEKRRTLISDALERVFENLAWKYRWG